MSGRVFALLAVVAGTFAVAACVDVPDNMRAEFSGPGPADRTNYRPGTHGTAPANWTHFKVSGSTYDAGAPDAAPAAVAPPVVDATDASVPLTSDGGNT